MEVKEYPGNARDNNMQLAVDYLEDTLSHMHCGKASARLLDGIRVDYYGSQAPVSNVANVQCSGRADHCHHALGGNRCSRR